MKKLWGKKGIIYFLITIQLVGLLPWQVLPVYAEEGETSQTGEYEAIEQNEKVKIEDLSKETQNKLEKAETELKESDKKEEPKEVEAESLTISDTLKKEFLEKEIQVVNQVANEATLAGKEEQLDQRTEYSKTFIDPKTAIGETVLFSSPIHEKDGQGQWQSIEPDVKETDQEIQIAEDQILVVPKEINEKKGIQLAKETTPLEIGLPNVDYEVVATNENHILMQSKQENEPAEISMDQSITEIAQYIDTKTNLEELTYTLHLNETQTATLNQEKGGIEIKNKEQTETVIPYPTLMNTNNELIMPLTFTYNDEKHEIKVEPPKEEVLQKMGQAKVSLRAVPMNNETIQGVNTTSIRQYDDKMSYAFQNYMIVGYDNGYSSGDDGAAHFQTYGIVNIPNKKFQEITRSHEIMSATLKVKRIGDPGFWGDTAKDGSGKIVTRQFEAAPLTKDVGDFTSLTYDKFIKTLKAPFGPPANEDGKETKFAGIDTSKRWVDFDITTTANDWKNGVQNYGMLLKNNKMSSYEMPYSQAEVFGGKGFTGAEPYVVLTHRERPPIDKNMPLKDTTMQLRPFVQSDNDGLIHFSALGLDGTGRPEAEITYRLKDGNDTDKVIYTGTEPSIGRDYLYPNYPVLFDKAQKYVELSSNWQTKDLLTSVLKENHLYKTEATINYTKNNKNESVEKKYDTFQLYKVSSQDTLPRLLAFYGVEKNRASFMRDNNMKDDLLTQGNIVFIRNPKKNAGKAYTPKPLTKAEKIRLDSLSMGRGKHCQFGFEPINIGSGNFLYETTDSTWFDGELEEKVSRTYNAMGQGQDSWIGRNWTINQLLSLNQLADKSMMLTIEDGGKVFFNRKSDGSYEVEGALPYTLQKSKETVEEVEKRLFILEDTAKRQTYTFDASGQIRTIKNSHGQEKKYSYDGDTGLLKDIRLFNGKKITFKWNAEAHLSEVIFADKTNIRYEYNQAGDLTKVTDALGKVFTYQYDDNHRMISYAGNDGKAIYQNEYDKQDRVIKQTNAVGTVTKLAYGKDTTTITDGNGNQTTTTFNDHYQPTKVTYSDGSTETNRYNDRYQLIEATNRKGEKTTYTYDGNGNNTSKLYADGTKEQTTYNQWSQPLVETNRQGKTKTHSYDEYGNEQTLVNEKGEKTTYTYNEQGEKITETNAQGEYTTYTYHQGNLASITDSKGVLFSYTYDEKGFLLTETDGNQKTKSYQRNARGELVSETNFNGATKQYSYDEEGNQTSWKDYNGNQTTYAYNAIGQMIKETNPLGGTKTYTYDGNGNLIEESDYLGNQTKMTYDAFNQKQSVTFSDGTKATYTYDLLGNVTEETLPNGNTTTYEYDFNGFLKQATNSLGHKTIYERNTDGQPTKIIYPNLTEEHFSYDELGNLLTKKEKNNLVTTYTYNQKSEIISTQTGERKTQQTFDVRGNRLTTTNSLDQQIQTNFDGGGYLKESIEADGTTTQYETDAEGNVVKQTEANGVITICAYDANGNKIKEVNPNGDQTLYTYNALNLVETIVYPTGDIEQYSYDANGNLSKKIDSLGNETIYAYTATNEIKQVTDPNKNSATFDYDKGGNVTSFTDVLGRVTTYKYNEIDQLIEEITPLGVVTTYSYDKAGNVIRVTDSTDQSESYTHNALGQVTSVTDRQGRKESYRFNSYGEKISETAINGNQTLYAYDLLGRQIESIRPQGTKETTTYDTRDRVINRTLHNGGTITYEYDQVGNLIKEINAQKKNKTYTYDANRQLTELIDENGGKTEFKYDARGRVIETTDARGNQSKQSYDANNNVIKEVDPQGNQTTYAYDALNQVIESVDAKGFKETMTYDAAGRKISENDSKGQKTSFSYDAGDNLIETTDALKRKTTFTYDLRNQLTEVTDASGAKQQYTYNADGTLQSETNAKGYQKKYQYDEFSQQVKITDNVRKEALLQRTYDQFGQVTKETKSNKQTTRMNYDAVGRLTKMIYPNQTNVQYAYDVFNRVETMTDIRGNKTAFTYDGLGNVTELTAPNGGKTKYEYDQNSNLLKETDPLSFVTQFSYNKNNQVTQTTDAIGGTTKQQYDERSQVAGITDANGYQQTYTYDGNGNTVESVDAKGAKMTFAYDAVNRLTKVTNRLGKSTQYSYDKQDNVTKIIDANNGATTFEYSPVGELEKQVSANGKTETFTYRLDGQIVENEKANGETIVYSYDELNRMIGKQLNHFQYSYEYDDTNELVAATTTGEETVEIDNSILKEKLPNSHQLTLERNQYGDIVKATTNQEETISYTYDAFGRRTGIIYPNESNITYTYDQKNQLKEVIEGDQKTTYQYDGLGQVNEINYGDGTKTTYTYTKTGEIATAITYAANQTQLSKQAYIYDKNGNTIQEELSYPKFKLSKAYDYDQENQLIKVVEKENKIQRETSYIYDNVGNRLASKQVVNGKDKGYQEWTNNSDNQLVEITGEKGATFEYDKNGHVSKKLSATGEVTTYLYDTEGRLIQATSNFGTYIGYFYDALGNRVSKGTVKETDRKLKTDLMEWMKGTDREAQLRLSEEDITLEEALNAKQNLRCLPKKERTWIIDHKKNRREEIETKEKESIGSNTSLQLIKTINDYTQEFISPLQQTTEEYQGKKKKTTQATYYYDSRGTAIGDDLDTYHQDGLSSNITQTTKAEGRLYSSNLYQEFGRSERPIANQAGYRSQYHDDWKQQHLRAREYDTTTGRFQQQDIVTGQLDHPVTQNKYSYANNNPFVYRDDAGRWGWVSKAWNAVKKVAKKVVSVVNKYVVQPVVRVVKKVVNYVSRSAPVRAVQQVYRGATQTYQQAYRATTNYVYNSARYVSNQVSYYGQQATNWVGTKAQQAQVAWQSAREYTIQVAQETRKKAEARIRKMCEGASTVWKSATKSVGDFVKKHEGGIKVALGVGTIILSVIPVTAPFGLALGTALSVASVNNAVTGKDWLSGRELGTAERVVEGVLGGVGAVSGMGQIAKQAVNSGLVDQAVTAGTKAVVGVKDSITSNATNTVSKTKDPLLEMDLQMFGNKGTSAGSTGSNVEKASGANVNKPPRSLIDNMDEIADDIRNINKKYSSGLEQNNSIDSIINSASYYEDGWEQTSAVTRSVAEHAFVDGNKRTAFDTLNMLLDDLRLKSPLNDTQKWDLINRIGTGDLKDVSEIANILKGK